MKPIRILAIGVTTAVLIASASAWLLTRPDGPKPSPVAQFSSDGVTVTVSVKDRSANHATIVATFSPDQPGYHLYSADLPANGIQGVGRPIKVTP
jgi:hypothetical protein